MLKIYMKLNTNFQLTKEKSQDQNDPIALVEYSNDMQDVYKHIDEYNEQKTPQNVNSF